MRFVRLPNPNGDLIIQPWVARNELRRVKQRMIHNPERVEPTPIESVVYTHYRVEVRQAMSLRGANSQEPISKPEHLAARHNPMLDFHMVRPN